MPIRDRKFIEYLVWAKQKWPPGDWKPGPAGRTRPDYMTRIGKTICLHAVQHLIRTQGFADMEAIELLLERS